MRLPFLRLFRCLAALLVALSLTASAGAATEAPDRMLARTTADMIKTLREEREAVRSRPQYLFELVDRVLSPRVDFPRMSRWVLGKYWNSASADQQQRFMEAFRVLMVRFYTAALLEDPKRLDDLLAKADGLITYLPASVPADAETVTVRSEVHLPDGKLVPVHFSVHRKDGEWKVFDVSVEGISVITNYRSSFASQIQQGGLDSLIEEINAKNRSIMEKVAAK